MNDELKYCKKHHISYTTECHSCYREQSACMHGVPFDSECEECEECEEDAKIAKAGKKQREFFSQPSIESIQADRGSVYGRFSEQAECVGNIIGACMTASKQGGELMSMGSKEIGAVAYIAIKLARYAVSPTHADTLIDLESYCNLIKKMEVGDDM